MSGLIRRFDDLGRIVIPKEIRTIIFEGRHKVEGEPMKVTVEGDKIILERYIEKTRKLVNATAIYTGGNIYIYYGKLSDGNYFRACDEWDFIEVCDADTSVEDADYNEFYEDHSIETIGDKDYETFWNEMLLWIIHNAPKGNYQAGDLEDRIIK